MHTLEGKIKSARAVKISEEKMLFAMDVTDEDGTIYACQMWPDDPQQPQLLQVADQLRRQKVRVEIVTYTVRMRKFKDNTERPQVNFLVTNVAVMSTGAQASMAQGSIA